MRFLLRVIVIVLALLVVVPLTLFVAYDATAFQSRRPEIAALIAQASPDERNLSPQVAQLTRISLDGLLAATSARLLLQDLSVPWVLRGQGGWHLTSLLWWACVKLHLSEQEQLTLIASRSLVGHGRHGYSAEAQARFGRPLSSLSTAESATLVALSHSPTTDSTSPERLNRRRDWLLSRLTAQP